MREEYESGREPRMSENFGMRVEPQRVMATGRVLEPCKVVYGGHNAQYKPNDKGSWNLRNVQFTKPMSARWAMVVCVEDQKFDTSDVKDFIGTLNQVAQERDMRLGAPVGRYPIYAKRVIDQAKDRSREGLFEKFLTDEVRRLESENANDLRGEPIGLLVAVMGDTAGENGKYIYPALKRWSHSMSGIPVQCCQYSKALVVNKGNNKKNMANDKQYFAGLLLKMNLKLGGENCYAITPERVGDRDAGIDLMMKETSGQGTMVVGLDVHHASPGSQGASYAALVATLDQRCVKVRTIVTTQEMLDDPNGGSRKQRQEIVLTLEESMQTLLHDYRMANQCLPRRIIFFRDGVAHNQFEAVAEQEIEAVRRACGSLQHMPIQLVFIVTQMRTRARLATDRQGRLDNVECGTVVDRDITGAGTFEFYMQPHHALIGSGRVSHYHVLENDCRFTPDEVQRFAFDLCHLYQRATKIVSRPVHLYYAHLAAALGPYYDASYKERDGNWDVGSTSSHGSHGSGSSSAAELHPTMKNRVYYA